jgi:hypothetical protein
MEERGLVTNGKSEGMPIDSHLERCCKWIQYEGESYFFFTGKNSYSWWRRCFEDLGVLKFDLLFSSTKKKRLQEAGFGISIKR